MRLVRNDLWKVDFGRPLCLWFVIELSGNGWSARLSYAEWQYVNNSLSVVALVWKALVYKRHI